MGLDLADRLSDPPDGIGDESESPGRVKSLRRGGQSNITRTDQILQWNTGTLVRGSDLDHKPQIGGNHLIACLFATHCDPLRKRKLFFSSEGFGIRHIVEVEIQQSTLLADCPVHGDYLSIKRIEQHFLRYKPDLMCSAYL